jgi:hypothetical protein
MNECVNKCPQYRNGKCSYRYEHTMFCPLNLAMCCRECAKRMSCPPRFNCTECEMKCCETGKWNWRSKM